ncbi:MAG TPA: lipopolysaccharide assembly protein LapA domain-containing protein [Gammaproteobacteria bacterium]
MALLRKIVVGLLLILLVLFAAVFSYNNPEPISVDVGLTRFERVPLSIAFAVVLAIGWIGGLLTAAFTLLRMSRERRRLRLDLKHAEAELDSLRNLSPPDAH